MPWANWSADGVVTVSSSGHSFNVAQPSRYVETFIVESWAEELRRHEHVTVEDRAAEDRVLDFLAGRTPPIVTHFVAEHLMHESRHNHAAKATGPF
jgi:transmembrane secretion effector